MSTLKANGASPMSNDETAGDPTNVQRPEAGHSNIPIPPVAPNYVDITDVFAKEAQKIRPGELAMLETFELVNAINALEIMDLKMDTGLLDMLSRDKEFDTTANRAAKQVLWVMDELFAMEMSWHTGGALSQTVFTCLYIEQALKNFNGCISSAHFGDDESHEPMSSDADLESVFVHVVLRAFVLGIIKTCDLSRRRLQCNEIMEDEDIVTQTYSLDLMQFVPVSKICSGLTDAINKMKRLKTESSRQHVHDQEKADLLGCIDGFIVRLELRILMIKALDAADDAPEKQIELLAGIGDLIRRLASTISLAESLPVAFSIAIQGRLECGMPPRPKVEMSFGDAITTLERLINGTRDVLRIHDYGSLGDITGYFEEFAMRRPTELPYVRCQLFRRSFVHRKIFGKFPMRDAVIADITDLCCPSPALFAIDESHPCRQALDLFLTRAEVCFENLFSIMCHNRARLRQRLCGAIMDWDSLQVDSEHLESSVEMLEFSPLLPTVQKSSEEGIRALPLSSWVYFRKLQIMIWIIFMGFELDIYRLEEWPLMLWYGDYILGVMDSHVARIETILEITATMQQASTTYSTTSRKSKKNNGAKSISATPASGALPPSQESIMRTRMWLAGLRSQIGVYKELCHGYMCFMAAMVLAGCVRSFTASPVDPSRKKYTTPELLYKLRLKPFSTIGVPEIPSFETYQRLTDLRDWQIDSLLDNAQITVNSARNMTDVWSKLKPEQQINAKLVQESSAKMRRSLTRSCVGTNVAISVLRQMKLQPRSFGEENNLKISVLHDNFHPFFPVLSVSTRK
ncbi:Mak10 subunit, NatC N-terminal acetyltransferase-domain-containing protein [Lipomyces chichibuensis]|uniref:Mak10 subunit, NatC N-terminal acetyltransferase-domain-containing protein n=1 Tax=Lipomyces chichibuensis TaxID=1546026 RepID=UPI003343F192